MIDVMFGDPLLSPWEKSFVESVGRAGWFYEYTPKQKAILKRIYNRQVQIYTKRPCEENGGEPVRKPVKS